MLERSVIHFQPELYSFGGLADHSLSSTNLDALSLPLSDPESAWRLLREKKGDGIRTMDLSRMPADSWFHLDPDRSIYKAQLIGKERILSEYPMTCQLLADPKVIEATKSLAIKIAQYLSHYYADEFQFKDGVFTNRILNQTFKIDNSLSGAKALALTSKMVEEDLVLVHIPEPGKDCQPIFAAGLVCFPSGWSLSEKIGQTIWQVHQPAGELNEFLGRKIDKFLSRVSAQSPMLRVNSFITSIKGLPLKVPQDIDLPKITANIGEDFYLRNEIQTFVRLSPEFLVFSIRPYSCKLKDLPPDIARSVYELYSNAPKRFISEHLCFAPEVLSHFLEYLQKIARGGGNI